MDLVRAHPLKYGSLAQCPITALALAILFEDMGGKLPSRLTDFYSALLKHMTRINLLRRGEPMCYDALPDKYVKLFQVLMINVQIISTKRNFIINQSINISY